jgi:hypothetical protein
VPDYIFIAASRSLESFTTLCGNRGVPLAVHRNGQFAIVIPEKRVLPEDVRAAWQP